MKRVVITGMGVISPIGNNIDTFWNNLKNGVCGIDFIKSIPTENLPVKIAAEVKDFNPADFGIDSSTVRRTDLFAQYALAAANQAMEDSKLKIENPERLGVYIGTGVGGIKTFVKETEKVITEGVQWVSPLFVPMMIANMAGGNVAIAHNAQGPCLPVVTACATGTNAIGEAYRAIQYGYADAIIAGGAEAAIEPVTIGGFANSKALTKNEDPKNASIPFDKNRNGFVLGEGAGVVILEEYEHAVKRNAKIYAEITGYGHTCDAHHLTAPKPDGSCASRAMKTALAEAGYNDNDLLYVNAHGTSTPLNDKSETLAIKLAVGEEQARKAYISSNKSMFGHMLGAAGAVELVATALTIDNGIVPPTIGLTEADPDCDLNYVPGKAVKADITIALSNSLGFGGHNASLTIRKLKIEKSK
ncbi:beta-ketoacyl-ACP synthase II [Bacteroidales bacterium OttesenSCG-928-K03]|nr:beta-ketoacyl-ACP synthase II [Odoribacter sp. OttesenSCG-928-L07]MDL2239533.1 beta-ketoacyl-ACP synthase II [Bacteroidales bacterium OttesenSCG-928-L14]MDL2243074.1 beta-ketoacyl-ACP synthase II [Bacteroidales bacterium OttesenSCG-928-K03]